MCPERSVTYVSGRAKSQRLFACPEGHMAKNGRLELGALNGRDNIRDDYDQAGVQFHLAEQPNKVDAIICDEREFTLDDSIGQFPVRPAAQTEVVDVVCFETSAMSDSSQRLMQAFVNQEPLALLSSVLSG